jgi:hypothetical protein
MDELRYLELMAELDDSDEVGDPQDDGARDPNGYCKHGVYVGGCGIDFMCGRCECGDD